MGLVSLLVLWGAHSQPQALPHRAPPSCQVEVVSTRVQPNEPSQGQTADQTIVFGGIGAYVTSDVNNDNRLTVVEPLEGTPAFRSGLKGGDVIEQIDGRSTDGLPIEQAVGYIRGTEGSVVHLTVYRPSTDSSCELDITRAEITAPATTASR